MNNIREFSTEGNIGTQNSRTQEQQIQGAATTSRDGADHRRKGTMWESPAVPLPGL